MESIVAFYSMFIHLPIITGICVACIFYLQVISDYLRSFFLPDAGSCVESIVFNVASDAYFRQIHQF